MLKNTKMWVKIVLVILLVIVCFAVALLGFLRITEFRPAAIEEIVPEQNSNAKANPNNSITLLSWNVGYCGLGEGADFFMDGGKNVRFSDKELVGTNVEKISEFISDKDTDIVMLQEVDRNSYRSYYIDQYEHIKSVRKNNSSVYARNFKCEFVPFPLPPIGKVDSGVALFSKYEIKEASRHKLPNPFPWPVSMANLKRCLEEVRIPIENSDKELVVINLHLEAFDDGEGKIAQTNVLREIMESERNKGNYVIAGGDFNQVFSNIDYSAYPAQDEEHWRPGLVDTGDFNDGWQFLMDNSNPTCRALSRPYEPNDPNFQYFLIDGFIVSDNIEVEDLETINNNFVNSDHNPVRLQIRLIGE